MIYQLQKLVTTICAGKEIIASINVREKDIHILYKKLVNFLFPAHEMVQ